MKFKLEELASHMLDLAVAKADGLALESAGTWAQHVPGAVRNGDPDVYAPSRRWEQGGPIIERERIGVWPTDHFVGHETRPGAPTGNFGAEVRLPGKAYLQFGHTPLIAAMRAYVATKLGEEVELP